MGEKVAFIYLLDLLDDHPTLRPSQLGGAKLVYGFASHPVAESFEGCRDADIEVKSFRHVNCQYPSVLKL